jgi:hypothetical protein
VSEKPAAGQIDRLKSRFEAKNLVHLVAKLVATQIERREKGSG